MCASGAWALPIPVEDRVGIRQQVRAPRAVYTVPQEGERSLMGVPVADWVECMKRHPALWRFEGLDSRRGGKDSFFTDVREACVASEEFMNHHMEDIAKGRLDDLKEYLKADPDPLPEAEANEFDVENYAQFLRGCRWRDWEEDENINHAPARKVIKVLEPKNNERVYIDHWGEVHGADALRYAWAHLCADSDVQYEWDYIKQDEPEYYLKDHPPVEMWSHAYEQGVPLDEIIFVCPGCGREPIQQKDVNGAHYYCGLCGAEACPDEGQTLESWASDMSVKLWPFKEKEKTV